MTAFSLSDGDLERARSAPFSPAYRLPSAERYYGRTSQHDKRYLRQLMSLSYSLRQKIQMVSVKEYK